MMKSDRTDDRSRRFAVRVSVFRELGLIMMLVVITVVASLIEPRFADWFTLRNILLWIPLLVVVAMGEMMVIITRGIDVSVGSTLGFAAMVVGLLFIRVPDINIYLATAVAILVGATLGTLNGTLIALAKVPPIVATLGTLSTYRGLTFIISGGRQVDNKDIPQELVSWSRNGLFGLDLFPQVVLWAVIVAILAHLFLSYTRTGRNIYAIGGNPEAARLRGVPVRRTLVIAYTLCGALAGLAGVLYASRFGFINPGKTGVGVELSVIAAVVIGGTNIFGGSGRVLGVVLGCLLLGTINVALATLGVAGSWQLAVYGFVILFAIVVDYLVKRSID